MRKKIEYNCDDCDFICSTKRLYNQHIKSYKHRLNINDPTLIKSNLITCDNCGEIFGSKTTIWRHKKNCILLEDNNIKIDDNSSNCNNNDNNLFYGLLNEILNETKKLKKEFKNQSETIETLKKVNLEQYKKIEETIPKINKTTNNINVMNDHSNNLNINVFLNEKCKNAINLSEFVNSIVVKIDDLERTKNLGFVKGISTIIISNLNKLDIYKRPIHCINQLQEILYVKDNNIWSQEDDDKRNMKCAIDAVAKKQLESVKDWENSHKDWHKYDKETDEYIKIIKQITNTEKEQNKIVKNIAKEVFINKTSK